MFYGLLSLWLLAMSRGAVLAMTDHLPTHGSVYYQSPFIHWSVTGWKLLSLGGVLVLAATAGRSVLAFQWLVVGQICWLISDQIAAEADSGGIVSFLATIVIWNVPWLLASPHRRQAFALKLRPDRTLCVIWLLAALPLIVWTLSYADTGELGAVGIPATLMIVGAWAALRPSGARWPALCVAITTLWTGAGAIAWPSAAGSPGRAWGLVLIAVGLAVLARITAHERTHTSKGRHM
jgi:hypothetical protein